MLDVQWSIVLRYTYFSRLGLDLQLRDHQLDGAALDEDGEEDDEERCRQEDVLKRVVLVQDGDQRKSDGTSQAAVGQNELLLEVKECPMSRIELYLTPMGFSRQG